MDISAQIISSIIKEQENIIGPIALEQARKVPGLVIDDKGQEVKLTGNEKDIIEALVGKYQELFGKASVEVCRDAVRSLLPKLPKEKTPAILQ